MKQFWATFGGQVAAALLPVAIVGLVGLIIWRKIFGPGKTAEDVVNATIEGAASLPRGVASLIGSTVRGESEKGYITDAQQRLRAAAELARKRAGQGV